MLGKIFLTLILSYSLFNSHIDYSNEDRNSVNSILGDISFIEKFGEFPKENTDENLRLITHLKYVEKKLREADVSHLSIDQQYKRIKQLDHLRQYIEEARFPKNYNVPNKRQSVFIDKDGAICAVGYLVEKTAGRAVAESINKKFKYANIFEIEGVVFENWVKESGFTKKELAMIQPMYGVFPQPESNDVSTEYEVSSSVLVGVNTALSFVNTSQIFRGTESKTIPITGLITGTSQLILGIANYPKEPSLNERKRDLSFLNIGFSTLTIALSSYNLLKIKENEQQSYAIRVKNFALPENNTALGLSFSKSF